jgi:MFS family permease
MADSGTAQGKRTTVLAVLRANRRLRWFGTGLLTSRVGDMFNGLALAWLALKIAGPRELGLVVLCAGLSRVPVSPLAGQLLDRFSARTLLIADNLGRACVVAIIPLLAWAHVLHVWHLYVIAAVTGALSTLTDVGENLVTPALVPDEQLEAANAVMSVTWEAASLIGPAAAGLVIDAAGIEAAFVFDALSFVVMAATTLVLPRSLHPAEPAEPAESARPLARLAASFRTMAALPSVVAMTVISLVFLLLSGAADVAYPPYSKYVLGTGAGGLGVLMAAAGLGAVLGVLLVTPRLQGLPPRLALGLVLAVHGALFVPLALIRSLPAAMVVVFLVYAAGVPFYPIERTIVQRAVPAGMRGRVFGARRALTAGGFPVGAGLAGPLVVFAGAAAVLGGIGLALCGLAVAAWYTPSLARSAWRADAPPAETAYLESVG